MEQLQLTSGVATGALVYRHCAPRMPHPKSTPDIVRPLHASPLDIYDLECYVVHYCIVVCHSGMHMRAPLNCRQHAAGPNLSLCAQLRVVFCV